MVSDTSQSSNDYYFFGALMVTNPLFDKPIHVSSSQDGGIDRNISLPHITKRRITTNQKSINNQKHQKIKLHGIPTTKELKKKSTSTTRWVRQQTTWANSEKPRGGCGRP